ncbi:MAG TPA: polymorphic toxin type 50 domain-containing protein, partial [Paludibacter sp.]|nr:polymorphic toxin type 50 domain-containing protein [Paludibacter sp.]
NVGTDGCYNLYTERQLRESTSTMITLAIGWLGGELIAGYETAQVAKTGTTAVSDAINVGKQGKHLVGHNNYIVGRSILTEDAQGLLDAFHAGNVESTQIINGVKTRVDFGKIIGTYINPETGDALQTTRGIIINSKTGVHIVPSAPF